MKKKHWKQHVTTVILSATLFLVLIFMSGKLGMVAYASDKISGEVGTLKWYFELQMDGDCACDFRERRDSRL